MGLQHHDRYKELKMMQDADQIVADCADLIADHALDAAKAREVVQACSPISRCRCGAYGRVRLVADED